MPDETQQQTGGAEVTQTQTQSEPHWSQRIFDPSSPGKLAPKWQESLPPELDPAKPMLAQYGDLETIFKSLKDNKDMARQKAGVKKLGPDATPEQLMAYRQEFGIPETPYEYKRPEQLPEGVEWRDDRMKTYGEWAHKNNLSPEQAQAGLDLYMGFISEDAKTWQEQEKQIRQQHTQKEQQELKDKFGGKLDSVISNAQRAALMRGWEVDRANPDSPKYLGNEMLALLNDYAAAVGESRLPSAAGVVNMTPEREYMSITKDKSNPKHALWASGDKETLAQVAELRRRMVQQQGGTLIQSK